MRFRLVFGLASLDSEEKDALALPLIFKANNRSPTKEKSTCQTDKQLLMSNSPFDKKKQ